MQVGKWNKQKQSQIRKSYENNPSMDKIKSSSVKGKSQLLQNKSLEPEGKV